MKIALICRNFWPFPGGLTLHALRLAQNLQARGHEVTGITRFTDRPYTRPTFYKETEATREYVTEGVSVHVIGLSAWDLLRLKPLLRLWWKKERFPWAVRLVDYIMRPKFRRLFRAGGFDVIHFDGSGHELWGFPALAAAREMNLPFIVQPSVHIGEWGISIMDLSFYERVDALVVHSDAERDALAKGGFARERIQVVYNGIDDVRGGDGLSFRVEHKIQGPTVLFIGRKSEDKGYDLLRRAFTRVVSEVPEAKLILVGPPRETTNKSQLRDDPWVVELDNASELEKKDALAACDLFCMPSRGESFGLGYMEAGLCGKPVIGRNLPVLEDLLGQHGAAVLVGKRDERGKVEATEEDVANAILHLIQNPDEAAEMGQRAREQAEKYLWDKVVGYFEAVYEDVQRAENSNLRR